MPTHLDRKKRPFAGDQASAGNAPALANGNSLLDQVIALTGLPEDALRKEMSRALAELERNPDDLDLENLRELVANYVQDVLVGLKDDFEKEN